MADPSKHVRELRAALSATGETSAAVPGGELEFSSLYDAWFDRVSRWLGALGASEADREDLAQDVFLVVRRRLRDFDGRNVAGWLYRIASRQLGQHRRRRWLRMLFSPRQPLDLDDFPSRGPGPVADLETKEKRELLDRLLAKMSERRRGVFVLFEVEGFSGEEIAEMLDVPVNTIWTRLHHARKDFFELLAQHRRQEKDDET